MKVTHRSLVPFLDMETKPLKVLNLDAQITVFWTHYE